MIQRELQREYIQNTLLTHIKVYIYMCIYILPLDKFATIIETNTIIDKFYTSLCTDVHFQHCFLNLSRT